MQPGEPTSEIYAEEQISLFSAKDIATGTYAVNRRQTLTIAPDALQAWKQKVLIFQQQFHQQAVPGTAPIGQTNLFETLPDPHDSEMLNPIDLPPQNTQFWRWKAEDAGVSALYFVIDYELDLLLYVGETVQSNQRWKGAHDCKRYLLNYQQAHYQFNLPTQLGIAFWQDAPTATRARQKMESTLIFKWRSPFNKENWAFWGTPFTGGK
jgi:hypothetical protein